METDGWEVRNAHKYMSILDRVRSKVLSITNVHASTQVQFLMTQACFILALVVVLTRVPRARSSSESRSFGLNRVSRPHACTHSTVVEPPPPIQPTAAMPIATACLPCLCVAGASPIVHHTVNNDSPIYQN